MDLKKMYRKKIHFYLPQLNKRKFKVISSELVI